MTNLAVTDDLFFDRTGMDPQPGRGHRRRGTRRHGRRRALPRIQPVGKRRARRRPHQERRVRHDAGLRAARGGRRSGRLCPCFRIVRGGDPPRRRRRCAPSPAATTARSPSRRPAPTARSIPTQPARHRRSGGEDQAPGRDRRLCPRPRPARPPGDGLAVGRLAGGADRAPRATAAAPPTSARWCGSTSRSWSATATAWKPARTAPAGASPTITTSTRCIGGRRSTRPCARRSSISARCRRRPAR